MDNYSDNDFTRKIKIFAKIDDEKLTKLLSKSSITELIAIAGAVSKDDEEKVYDLVHHIIDEESFDVGDLVNVDGRKSKIVDIDDENDTIDVKRKGKLRMVNKDDVEPLTEQVMGISMIEDIQRITQLAGIPQATAPNKIPNTTDTTPIKIPNTTDTQRLEIEKTHLDVMKPMGPSSDSTNNDNQEDELANVEESFNKLSILDTLNSILEKIDDVRISELSLIRNKLTEINNKINETLDVPFRKLK